VLNAVKTDLGKLACGVNSVGTGYGLVMGFC